MQSIYKTIILFLAVIPVVPIMARAQPKAAQGPAVYWYEADGQVTAHVAGCRAGTSISFYSEAWGGHCLAQTMAGNDGDATLTLQKDLVPAFVINKGGSNQVTPMPLKTFVLSGIALTSNNGQPELSFKGNAPAGGPVAFELLRSSGSGYRVVSSYRAGSFGMAQYTFADQAGGNEPVFYKIRAVSPDLGTLYTSVPLSLKNGLALYPSVVDDILNINISIDQTKPAGYRLVDAGGKTVAAGALQNGHNAVPVGHLASGTYILVAGQAGHMSTGKVIRQ